VRVLSTGSPLESSVESFLGSAVTSPYLLDLRELAGSVSSEADPIREERPMRFIGSVYDPGRPEHYYSKLRLADQFDLVLFIQVSTPSTPLGG
jgi:erythromycin esterase-like protein